MFREKVFRVQGVSKKIKWCWHLFICSFYKLFGDLLHLLNISRPENGIPIWFFYSENWELFANVQTKIYQSSSWGSSGSHWYEQPDFVSLILQLPKFTQKRFCIKNFQMDQFSGDVFFGFPFFDLEMLILSAMGGGVKLTRTFFVHFSQPNSQAKEAEIFLLLLSIHWLKIWPKKIEFF